MKENLPWSKVFVPLDSCLYIHVRSVSVHKTLLSKICQKTGCFLHLGFLPYAGSGELTRQPWKRKCNRSLAHHPLSSCTRLEACQPINGQDHRKSPSAAIMEAVAEADVFSRAEEVQWGRLETRRTKEPNLGWGGGTAPGSRTPAGCRRDWSGCTSLPAPPHAPAHKTERTKGRDVTTLFVDNQTPQHGWPLFFSFSSIIEHQHVWIDLPISDPFFIT